MNTASRFLFLSLLLFSACAFSKHSTDNSLYTRLGKTESIRSIIDDFILNCVSDPRINSFFIPTASDPKRLAKFKQHLVDQICQASGGSCDYTGKDMKTAHKGLGISDQSFNALVENLVKSLDKFQVAKNDQEILLGVLGPMRKDIVEKH